MSTVHVRCWITGDTITVRPDDGRTVDWAVGLVLAGQREDPYADEIADAMAGHP